MSTADAEHAAARDGPGLVTMDASPMDEIAGKCSFQPDTDYQNSAGGRPAIAETKEACCEKCWADEYCVAGVFVDETCWMKYDNTGMLT